MSFIYDDNLVGEVDIERFLGHSSVIASCMAMSRATHQQSVK